jgi:membrane-bound lytic murein transglycosylase F
MQARRLSLMTCFFSLFLILASCSLENSPAPIVDEREPLRVLSWAGDESLLMRNGSPVSLEIEYLQRFADENYLRLEVIMLAEFKQLIPALLAGKGDAIASNLTITETRKKLLSFTKPITKTFEYLVTGLNSKPLKSPKDLSGREVVFQQGKAYEETAQGLIKAYPQLTLRMIDTQVDSELMMDKVAAGEFDIIIKDGNLLDATMLYRDDLQKGMQASAKREIAIAVAPDNQKLLHQLNDFLQLQSIALVDNGRYKNRWQKIKQTKTIRFVMRNNFSSYFIWRGQLLGFNYELAKKFAKDNGLRYEIVVAPDHASMLNYLLLDKADIALGFLNPTQRRKDKGIDFSVPYHYASQLLIAKVDDESISSIDDLANRTVVVRKSSAYWDTILAVKQETPHVVLLAASESQESEELIDGVGEGLYDLTVADSHIANLEMVFLDQVKSVLALTEPQGQGWAVKKGHDQLLGNINSFVKKYYKSLFYNVKYQQYFTSGKRIDAHRNDYLSLRDDGTLSPYDIYVKKYAKKYDFDWRLMIAQMHQESRFDPNARSFAGAHGLFQIMPRTAKQMELEDVSDPETGIHAGIKYMDWVRERMTYIKPEDGQLIWFTLAAYNAGAGHVRDAVSLARKKGWNPHRWFGHVEKAMLLLSKNEYSRKARHGYVRGHEPVKYVRAIKNRYDTFQYLVD